MTSPDLRKVDLTYMNVLISGKVKILNKNATKKSIKRIIPHKVSYSLVF